MGVKEKNTEAREMISEKDGCLHEHGPIRRHEENVAYLFSSIIHSHTNTVGET